MNVAEEQIDKQKCEHHETRSKRKRKSVKPNGSIDHIPMTRSRKKHESCLSTIDNATNVLSAVQENMLVKDSNNEPIKRQLNKRAKLSSDSEFTSKISKCEKAKHDIHEFENYSELDEK